MAAVFRWALFLKSNINAGEMAVFTEMHQWTLNTQQINEQASALTLKELSWAQYISSQVFSEGWRYHWPEESGRIELYKGKQNRDWNNYTTASDICTDSTLGLRHKYKHMFVEYRSYMPVAVLSTAVTLSPLNMLTEEKRQRSFRHSVLYFFFFFKNPVWGFFYLLIISFLCKPMIFFFVNKI